MAKPGSNHAKVLTEAAIAKSVDLRARAMSDQDAAKMGAELELALGMRCHGCGRRIGQGIQFTSIDPREADRSVVRRSACFREDCDFAAEARPGAIAGELREFAWFDAAGVDAMPIERIAEATRHRRVVREASDSPPAEG